MRRFTITHLFHPWSGQQFGLVTYLHTWGEHRAYFDKEGEHLVSVPASWTDIVAEDPVVQVGAGRSLFHGNDFFDPDNLVQVKYEMLRQVHIDSSSISESTRAFGFSRSLVLSSSGGLSARRPLRTAAAQARATQIALAIFLEVSIGFETMRDGWPYSWMTDSGFSVKDLVSDLIGFYKTARPSVDYVALCKPVPKDASLAIWDKFGSVGRKKNNTFRPIFYEGEECKKQGITPKFPVELVAIEHAKKGTNFRDWKYTISQVPDKNADEIIPTGPHYRR